MVHGDDFVSVGNVQAARKFGEQLESRFEIKKTRCSDGQGWYPVLAPIPPKRTSRRSKRGVLNRAVRWTADGWEVEPDQRHADLIAQEMGMWEARPVSTPGEAETKGDDPEAHPLSEKMMASSFRSIAARANYLAADCTGLVYSVKETCRGVANPGQG